MIKLYKINQTNKHANKKRQQKKKKKNTENRKEFVTSFGGSTEEFAVSID